MSILFIWWIKTDLFFFSKLIVCIDCENIAFFRYKIGIVSSRCHRRQHGALLTYCNRRLPICLFISHQDYKGITESNPDKFGRIVLSVLIQKKWKNVFNLFNYCCLCCSQDGLQSPSNSWPLHPLLACIHSFNPLGLPSRAQCFLY